jgi:PAS domain-containing protein
MTDMRDQHRPKQDLINEVAALRKQVADLKDSMAARRRVEDALRAAEEQMRALADGAPVGLCLFTPSGTPLAANRPFARLLGYESPSELLRVAGSLGVFANRDEESRVFSLVSRPQERVSGAIFRRKDGSRQAFGVIGGSCGDPEAIVVVVLERQPQPWRAPPLAALSQAWVVPTRSAS